MGKTIDLTDMIFGRWKVISYAGKNKWGHSAWNCICECGNEKVVDGKSLRRGESISCDCLRREVISKNQFKDLTGKIFGRLTVIRYIGKNSYNISNWLCKCSCGNKKEISTQYLSKKSIIEKSCGCVSREKGSSSFRDLSGKRYGKLVILKFNGMNKFQQSTWLCRCGCENTCVICISELKKRKSCGCLKESYIASELKKYCVKNYNADKSENREFINPSTKHSLPFDIYIPDRKIFIEIHGIQHYILCQFHKLASTKNGTTPEEEFEYQKKKDRMKRKYARKNGIYIEVDLRKIKTIEEAIIFIQKFI